MYPIRRQISPHAARLRRELCVEARLIVELDGSQHSDAADAARTRFLEVGGYRVQWFWNRDVVENRDGVLEAIRLILFEHVTNKKKALTQPSFANAGEGF